MRITLGDRARFKYAQISRAGRDGRLVAVRCVRPEAVEEEPSRDTMVPEAQQSHRSRTRGAKTARLAPSVSG